VIERSFIATRQAHQRHQPLRAFLVRHVTLALDSMSEPCKTHAEQGGHMRCEI
jgi:hypothetical protein